MDGRTLRGRASFLSIDLPNGTYGYSVSTVPGYTGTWSGEVVVAGGAVAADGFFAEVVYPVTLFEAGLPNGTTWSVTIHGHTFTSTSSTILVLLPNGTYPYRVGAVSGFTNPVNHSPVKVRGSSVNVAVPFRVKG